ncbi:hypothetical protein NPIL_480211 [Nephila pilipes]|uniref:Uncharacterized protein n=1 Tax=Nephila pilipes TaxID=299642 RepID=A0A8X6QCG0_NEPPI|nr:hypothetical protein NPIL_480211 [Nephila pilipes]
MWRVEPPDAADNSRGPGSFCCDLIRTSTPDASALYTQQIKSGTGKRLLFRSHSVFTPPFDTFPLPMPCIQEESFSPPIHPQFS